MRCLAAAMLLWLALAPGYAANRRSLNTLTPQEIADGWLLLFDGETTFGWKTDGEVKASGGNLVLGNTKESWAELTTKFLDYDLSFECRQEGSGSVIVGWDYAVPKLKILHQRLGVAGGWGSFVVKVRGSTGSDEIKHTRDTGVSLTIGPGPGKRTPSGVSHPVIGVDAGGKLSIRNVKLRPLGLTSIFNGKNLAGWKEYPGKKSKFTVNERGELNVKNGPGDLQTEKAWGDFVLQLECISNGKHLNSGVFFRCRPGEYQNGYEAQIRNQFTKEPRQAYLVEDYDRKTHKLVGKQKVMSCAVDYGTGAIYRRQPARKEAARDHEWFSMTVVADGNHFATWVNGYQEVDWTDRRPSSDNARTGFRAEAGPISLQGHDPTTDLSFRNFRIGALASQPR
jgi:hypothetical protein